MPDFSITIKTPTELAGAVAAAEALERDIGKAKALGNEFGELEKKLAAVKASIQQAEQNGIGGGEGFKVMGRGAHEAHAALHALNEAFPGLTQFARFLTSGFTVAIGAALLAFNYLNGKIEEFNKLLDSLNTGSGARGQWAEKIKQQATESAVAFDVWEHNINRLISAQERLSQATASALARDREAIASKTAVASAEKEFAEARLELAVKLGQITPEQAIKIKLEIDEEALRRQLEAKLAGIQAEMNAKQNQLNQLNHEGAGTYGTVLDTKAKADAAAAAKTKNDEQIAQAKTNKEAAEAAAQKADERLLQPHHWGDKADTSMREQAEEKGEEARRQAIQYAKEIKQAEAKKEGLDTSAETTKGDYDAAKAEHDKVAKDREALQRELNDLSAKKSGQEAENAGVWAAGAGNLETKAQGSEVDLQMKRDEERRKEEEKFGINRKFAKTASGDVNIALAQGDAALENFNRNLDPGGKRIHQVVTKLIDYNQKHTDITAAEHAALMQRINHIEGTLAARGSRS